MKEIWGNDKSCRSGPLWPPQLGKQVYLKFLVFHAGAARNGRPYMVACRVALCAMIFCKLALDQRVPIKNDFLSIADGSHFAVSANDDSEQSLYKKIGESETIRELMRLMIIASSNLATNILIERVTPARVMELMREMGAR